MSAGPPFCGWSSSATSPRALAGLAHVRGLVALRPPTPANLTLSSSARVPEPSPWIGELVNKTSPPFSFEKKPEPLALFDPFTVPFSHDCVPFSHAHPAPRAHSGPHV